MQVYGNLVVNGTKEVGVVFTSYRDDTSGGDTNNDGQATVPSTKDWQGIHIESGSSVDVTGLTVRYSGKDSQFGGLGSFGGIHNKGGNVSIVDSDFGFNGLYQYYQFFGTTTIVRSNMHDAVNCLTSDSGSLSVKQSVISSCSAYGINTYQNGTIVEIENNTFRDNGIPISFNFGNATFLHSGNTFIHNTRNAIYLAGNAIKNEVIVATDGPYVGGFRVEAGSEVALNPGVIVKVEKNNAIVSRGRLVSNGTKTEKIFITSIDDDAVGGDTNNNGSTTPVKGSWNNMWVIGGVIDLDNTIVRYGGDTVANNAWRDRVGGALLNTNGTFVVRNSEVSDAMTGFTNETGSFDISSTTFRNVDYGIYVFETATGTVSGSDFSGTNQAGIVHTGTTRIDARNNWWGDASGPINETSNPTGLGKRVWDNVEFIPWHSTKPGQVSVCCSNVLFLPGLKASRLYKPKTVLGVSVEDQLWEPNFSAFSTDVDELYLNADGVSLDQNIYTKDIIDSTNTAGPLKSFDIYKKVIVKLNYLVTTGKIKDWKPYAYDWRSGINDVLENGTKRENNQVVSLIDTVQSLVTSSQTGKVTIVAHSNGGLLAKALIKKLEDMKASGQSDLIDHIDTLVLIASPQLGTPSGLAATIHGYDQSLKFNLMSEVQARKLAINMSSAYGLMTSQKYFEQSGIIAPYVFASTSISLYRNTYGNDIHNYQEQHNFVLGLEGRTQPSESDLINPIKGNSALLFQAESLHATIDNMVIPQPIQVINIAGWGKSTIASMTNIGDDLQPIFTIRGDKTVVMQSALYGQGTKYWLDLSDSKLDHSDILEDTQLLDFLGSIIQKNDTGNLNTTEPIQIGNRLHVSVHSPVSVDIEDNLGNFTGKVCDSTTGSCAVQEDIPGSTYYEFGEGKYVQLSQEKAKKIVLQGTDTGTFTLDADIITPFGQTTTSTFIDIPVTTQTQGELVVGTTTVLKLDVTGDGVVDVVLKPSNTFEPIVYLQIIKATVNSLDISPVQMKAFDIRVDTIIESIHKGKIDKAKLKAESFAKALEKKIAKPDPKHLKPKKLSKTDAQLLLDMLNKLLDNLN